MKTVIVPVDFSMASLNAATYASKMLAGSAGMDLVLYHMYEKKNEAAVVEEQLANLKTSLAQSSTLSIETISVHGDDLIDEIERVVRHRHADLVVMGITGRNAIEQVFVGSNTLKMVDKRLVPVLIVPPDALFHDIQNVALASDFKNVRLATPSVPIKSVLEIFKPALHIVNVNAAHYISITQEYQLEKTTLEQMFDGYKPEFYFIGLNDFYDAIEKFIEDKRIDILITIPRQHSVLGGFLKERRTKKLAYQSHIPILAVHE
ncbi:MAG TPA: universal stress protein [Chitinophagaceae bacterium]